MSITLLYLNVHKSQTALALFIHRVNEQSKLVNTTEDVSIQSNPMTVREVAEAEDKVLLLKKPKSRESESTI